MYDVIIVGGGPAGLSAALILGRCRRRTLIFDDCRYRNAGAPALHGFLTRDGLPPQELLRLGREQLAPYGVAVRNERVRQAAVCEDGFRIMLESGEALVSRKLLLATGVQDRIPSVPGIDELYGRSVFHCPYCDAWEVRDQALGVYGKGPNAAGLALSLKTWSRDVVLCTDGSSRLAPADLERLARHEVGIRTQRIRKLEGRNGVLERIVFDSGETLSRGALFLSTGQTQRSDLAIQLGCKFTRKGAVLTGSLEGTNVPGLYVAGDASRDVQLAIVAAAEGAKAGFAINKALDVQTRT